MNAEFLMMNRPLGRGGYLVASLLIIAITTALAYAVYNGLSYNHHFFSLSIYLTILCVVFGTSVLITQTYRRMRDAGFPPMCLLLLFIAPLNILLVVALWIWPTRSER